MGWKEAQTLFLAKTPDAHRRAFVTADPYLLLAALELHAREATVEISRFRAVGLMLRNSALPLALGALVGIAEAVLGSRKVEAATVSFLLALAVLLAVRRSVQLRNWARMKTLQLAYWVPGIDERMMQLEPERRSATSDVWPAPSATSDGDKVLGD
jgi:hypothetical protein